MSQSILLPLHSPAGQINQTCSAAHGKHTLVAMVEISQQFILRAAKTRFFHSSS